MLGGFFMVRKGVRTGIFDLNDVDSIKLNPVKQQKEESLVIGKPQILVEPTEIKLVRYLLAMQY